MGRITNTDELRARIQKLREEKSTQEDLILQDVSRAYDMLKPAKIFRTLFKEISSTPDILENVFSNIASIFGGYVSRKVLVRKSNNVFKRILGTLTQFGVTFFIASHARQLKDKFTEIIQILSNAGEGVQTDDETAGEQTARGEETSESSPKD